MPKAQTKMPAAIIKMTTKELKQSMKDLANSDYFKNIIDHIISKPSKPSKPIQSAKPKMTNNQIDEFLDSVFLASETYKGVIKKRLVKWITAYELQPIEDEIEYLVNEILPTYFNQDEAQKFLDIYFGRILVSDFKK